MKTNPLGGYGAPCLLEETRELNWFLPVTKYNVLHRGSNFLSWTQTIWDSSHKQKNANKDYIQTRWKSNGLMMVRYNIYHWFKRLCIDQLIYFPKFHEDLPGQASLHGGGKRDWRSFCPKILVARIQDRVWVQVVSWLSPALPHWAAWSSAVPFNNCLNWGGMLTWFALANHM